MISDKPDSSNYNILEAKTPEVAAIKQLIKKLKIFNSDMNICFTSANPSGGLLITNLSDDKSVFVKIKLDASNFEFYDCKNKIIKAGGNIKEFYTIFKKLDDDNPITFYMNNNSQHILHIKGIINFSDNIQAEADLSIRLLDIANLEMPISQTVFQNKMTMDSDKFYQICKRLKDYSNFVEITTIKNEISFSSHVPSDEEKITITCKDRIYSNKNDDSDQVVRGVYELRNLMAFVKCNKLCNTIDIYLKNDFPLVLMISVATLGKMYVFLSPIDNGNN